MPHKYNADRRHHIPRARYKVTNWKAYEAGLRQRGSLTIWFSEEGVPRTHWQRWQCGAAHEMRGGPSKPAVRGRLQTASSCIGQEPVWCCVKASCCARDGGTGAALQEEASNCDEL